MYRYMKNKQINIRQMQILLKRRFKRILASLICLIVAMIVAADYFVDRTTDKLIFDNIDDIPHNKVGIVLGTSKYLKSGSPNRYFTNRVLATAELYQRGKIDCIVISGDNSRKDYNEPLDMKNDLIQHGIPENKIYLDYAGLRTYDSMIRIHKIFGQKSFTIISQEFHNRRAIFIAKQKSLEAVGYNAQDVDMYNGFKTKVRERFARIKLFIDLAIDAQPKHLGEPIKVECY